MDDKTTKKLHHDEDANQAISNTTQYQTPLTIILHQSPVAQKSHLWRGEFSKFKRKSDLVKFMKPTLGQTLQVSA